MPCPLRPSYTIPLPTGALILGERCLVMGILNVTPDSFGGDPRSLDRGRAVELALGMEADGAALFYVGGEASRPGAEPVTADEERARILPVLDALCPQLRVPVSVDTYKAIVAREAVQAGAAIINDVSGLQFDPALAAVAAETGAALVLMHTRGRPKTMYQEADYQDVAADVARELGDAVRRAVLGGVTRERIIVDPGIGFAKRPSHSYGVLARLAEIASTLGRPVLVGPSRKSFMREAVGGRPPAERDWGTAAAVTAAVLHGAHIVRVHAVAEMVQVVRVADEIRRTDQ
jgi:dihydropteroate synthase